MGYVFVVEIEWIFVSFDCPVEQVVEVSPVCTSGVVTVVEADVFSDLGESFVLLGDGAGERHGFIGVVDGSASWFSFRITIG